MAALMPLAPVRVAAQPAAPRLQRADLSGYLGWFNGNKRDIAVPFDRWYNESVFAGIGFGYYWTDHLKTEVELSGSSGDEIFTYESSPAPDGRGMIFSATTHEYSNRTLAVGQSYQFFRNQWFHPLIGAGIDLDWERHRTETPPFGPPNLVRQPSIDETTLKPKAFVLVGFKGYLAERAFFRSDLKIAATDHLEQVIWRVGFGVDF
ncbi:MAG: outer membrane beta-barrel protein [Acidobacteria bacterium]|nr:outer membrane beta-barrel protein [Acidobacteriota bacterium]